MAAPVMAMQFGENPVPMVCPFCNQQIVTRADYKTGTCTWVVCLVLCFVGLDCFCCLIPFCVNACKDVHHVCPACHRSVGVYKRM